MELSPRACFTNGEADAEVRTCAETSRVSRVLVRVRFPYRLTPSIWPSVVQPGICKRLLGACLERTRQEAVRVDSVGAPRAPEPSASVTARVALGFPGACLHSGQCPAAFRQDSMEHRRGQAGHSCDQIRPQLSAECCRQPSVSSFASPVILTLGTPRPPASLL